MAKLIMAVFLAVFITTVMSTKYRHQRRNYYNEDMDMDMELRRRTVGQDEKKELSLAECARYSKHVAKMLYLANGVFQPHIIYYLMTDYADKQRGFNEFAKALTTYWAAITSGDKKIEDCIKNHYKVQKSKKKKDV